MSAVPSEDAPKEIGDFFTYLWGKQEGYVYLPTKDTNLDPPEWKKVLFEWPKHKATVVEHVLASNSKGLDVYCAPVVFSVPRPLKENVKGSYVVWADFDGNAPDSWSSEGPKGAEDGTQAAQIPSPSLRIQSSVEGHEHIYWRLDEFVTDADFIENTNQAIAYTLKADTSGWDIGQVLRPPSTTNYKHGLPTSVIYSDNELSYSRSNFKGLKPVKQLVSETLDIADIPDVTRVVAKYTFDDDHYNLFMSREIEEGHRSHALMKIGYFGAESGMSDGEIYSLLLNADDRWGKFKHRSDRKKRLLDIINKARQKHPVGLSTPEGLLRSATDAVIGEKYLYGFQEFLDTDVHVEWVFEGLLEVGGIGMIAALPGVGKTQVSVQFGISAALGIPFLKWNAVKKMKVIFFSLEMGHATFKHFLENIAQNYNSVELEALERNFKIVPLGEALPLDTMEGRKFIEAIIEEYKPDGIIIDSMGKVTNGSLSDEIKIRQLNNYYVHLRNKYKAFVWFIHHNRKPNGDNKKPTELADLYGNQYIAAETTMALNLWDNKDGTYELAEIKNRLAEQGKPFNIIRGEHLTYYMESDQDSKMVDNLVSRVTNDEPDSSTGGPTILGF